MLDKLPKHTDLIFRELTKGRFICELSQKSDIKNIYKELVRAETFELLKSYFAPLNYQLERGEGFFYFSHINEGSQDRQEKLERFAQYIDILDFLVSLTQAPSVGSLLRPDSMAEETANIPMLKDKLSTMDLPAGDFLDKIRAMLRKLETAGFLERPDGDEENYKVLNSFNYLLQIIQLIEIKTENEA
jgi:hypothetical protein